MKRDISDLALFGGRAVFLYPLYANQPDAFDRTRLFDRMTWAFDNQRPSNGGPLVRAALARL